MQLICGKYSNNRPSNTMSPVTVVKCVVLLLFSAMRTIDASSNSMNNRFLSDVNLEHYYVIEENALSNANVLLRDDYFEADDEEDEEIHGQHAPNMTSFISVINEAKVVHRLAGPHLESFLSHPVNVYHLFRRLDHGWREGLQLLLESKPCKKWNLPRIVSRLRYLIDNLPGKEELERVVDYMAKLQNIYGISVQDIVQGKIGDDLALKPLTIEEQFAIVKVLHDKDDMRTALVWLQQIHDHLSLLTPEQTESLHFNQTDILHLMASAFYHIGDVSEALEKTERVLEIDPTNSLAASNRVFFRNKLASEKERNETGVSEARLNKFTSVRKQLPKYERLCGRKRQKATRKSCRLVRIGLMFYKVEPLRNDPPIVMFHDVIRTKTADVLKSYAHDAQTEQAWITGEKFRPPKFGKQKAVCTVNVVDSSVTNHTVNDQLNNMWLAPYTQCTPRVDLYLHEINKSSVKRVVVSLQNHLLSLSALAQREPEAWDRIQVVNVGLEGMNLTENWVDLQLYPAVKKGKFRKETGGYYVFLNDVKIGGEAIFADKNVVVHPEKGSVLFYYHSRGSFHSFCPVIGSSLWVAVQPVRDKLRNYCVDDDEWL